VNETSAPSAAAPAAGWFGHLVDKYLADLSHFFWDAFVALQFNGITGDYVEFGSSGAKSLSQAHEVLAAMGATRRLWAFDSFEGLPAATSEHDEHPVWGGGGRFASWTGRPPEGTDPVEAGLAQFHDDCARFGVPRDAYTPVAGWFEDTLPALGAAGEPRDIALAYVDCNMYSSTVTVLDFLAPRLKHGMVVAFDDYHMWTSTDVSGQRRALHEFAEAHPEWRFEPFKEVHWGARSFVVENGALLSGS
jgi:O-methyltransferase